MVNILIVDDELNILDIEKRVVERYFKKNDIENYEVDTALDGKIAIELMKAKDYDLLFLDYMMPKSNGLDVLKNIRVENNDKHQPFICMVTAMGTPENLAIFKKNKASSYVLKPFDIKTINLMLDAYIKPIVEEKRKSLKVDEFIDFDEFDEFEELNDFEVSNEEKNTINESNLNHKKIPASTYLKEVDNLEYILEDVNEIDEILTDIIESLDAQTLEIYKKDINTALDLYTVFLRGLYDFENIANTLELTKDLINDIDIEEYNEKKRRYIIETIRAILNDISQWKDIVFIKKDAVDVFYIVASNYNSYLQLKDLIQKTG
ncbi:MAG: response regulator [Campylobacterota bacterium]